MVNRVNGKYQLSYEKVYILLATGLVMTRGYALYHNNNPVADFLEWVPSKTFHVLRQLKFSCNEAVFITKIRDKNKVILFVPQE